MASTVAVGLVQCASCLTVLGDEGDVPGWTLISVASLDILPTHIDVRSPASNKYFATYNNYYSPYTPA